MISVCRLDLSGFYGTSLGTGQAKQVKICLSGAFVSCDSNKSRVNPKTRIENPLNAATENSVNVFNCLFMPFLVEKMFLSIS